jgi:pterin-4a-carbinolamine dehydratase
MATQHDPNVDVPLPPATIQRRLKAELPAWSGDAQGLQRRYRTEGWKATLLVVNAIGHLAEAADHHPDLAVSYAAIGITLVTHSAGGVTEKDFSLARKIEEVVLWHGPGAAPLVLELPQGKRAH